MLKSIVITLLLCFLTASTVNSQISNLIKRGATIDSDDYPNSVYIELLGNGILYSINYERRFYGYGHIKVYGRGGLGMIGYSSLWAVWFPIESSVAFGKKNNFETGIGCTFAITGNASLDEFQGGPPVIPLRIGYRLEIDEYLFRFGLTPFFNLSEGFTPMLGVSFGKRFDD